MRVKDLMTILDSSQSWMVKEREAEARPETLGKV